MRSALIFAAASTIGLAGPAFAQHSGHTMVPAPTETAVPPGDPSCPAEHAAMGHCTPKPAMPAPASSPAAASGQTSTAQTLADVDPLCPPEHEAMGHCKPKMPATGPQTDHNSAAPSANSAPAPAVTPANPPCSPEHAAMGHCELAAPMPAPIDPHASHNMAAAPAAAALPAVVDSACPPEHAAMGHCTPKGGAISGAPPIAPPPAAAFAGPEHAADTVWDPKLMAEKRATGLRQEHGGYTGYMVLFDQFEYRLVDGRDGYFVNAQAWYGGDYDRLWIKTEIESDWGRTPEQAEVQALWSRALDPWFNLQTGVRYDFEPNPERAHLVLGIQGLAPYWFEVDGALFLSDKGDLTARLEAEYDQRITQRIILQPRVEIDFALQNVGEIEVGSGLSKVEAGLRLRYEIKKEFAPYIGIEYSRTFGDTARFARADNEKVGHMSLVVGLRSWF